MNVRYDKKTWGLLILLTVLFTVLIRTAWLSDDAYITFRTIDNFINGYGLRWNVAERVQVYTHPLWCLLLSAAYFLTHDIYFTSLFISIVITLTSVYLLTFKIAQSFFTALVALLILIFSKAFIDFSTSGLENPLTHLLLILFALIYLRSERQHALTILSLSIIVGLILFNRLDAVLLVLPAWGWVCWQQRRWQTFLLMLMGLTPFILWELFALIYYGSLLPNTAYAKLIATEIGYSERWPQGLLYLLESLSRDPITLLTIITALAVATRRRHLIPLALGIGLSLCYVVYIGGDFMSGRFLTAPLLMAVIILTQYNRLSRPKSSGLQFTLLALVVLLGVLSPQPTLFSGQDYRATIPFQQSIGRIADERGYYYPYTGLLNFNSVDAPISHRWALQGKQLAEQHTSWLVDSNVGFLGYYAGPEVHIIDTYGITEPFLARLPAKRPWWRIGHFRRLLPEQYLPSLQQGKNLLEDQYLADLYAQIRLVTQGPLFTRARWRAIGSLNLGYYRQLIEKSGYDHHLP
ncbi:MAG: hypothetical protein SVR94_05230 [Pseudomonadota bacterium]|nr:hypothetical protein [Pseudomonadota bacterium]